MDDSCQLRTGDWQAGRTPSLCPQMGALLAEGSWMLQIPDLCARFRTIMSFVGAEKSQPLYLASISARFKWV